MGTFEMAYTQSDLDRLQKAMSNGILRTKFGEREVTYRSLDEMRALERQIKKELGRTRATQHYPKFESGL